MKIFKAILLSLILLTAFSQVRAQDMAGTIAGNKVIKAYLGVKNALTVDNNALAKKEAKKLLDEVTALPVDKLTGPQKTVWTTYVDKLEFDSRHISESDAIDHQREHFESLSKTMYQVVKGMKLNSVVVYQQYCPMKKATWLSESETIKNPYYGKEMQTCGKTTETLTVAAK